MQIVNKVYVGVSPQFECVFNILESSNISLYWMTLGILKIPKNIILINK